ncbi:MAG: SDR family oxidoreductase [Deltaproteobacteria bacterium]|nr:SDR family oxidoreductase [Deltaproteobacteria bacterium]MCB9786481.1 SDR family oxidoreductase [Deltaproteobacteria bacterium]
MRPHGGRSPALRSLAAGPRQGLWAGRTTAFEVSVAGPYSSVFRDGLFAGEVALVTGGGTGIGRCIAHELAALGATVVVSGRRPEPLDAVVAEIHEAGGRAAAQPMNIRDEVAVDEAIAAVVARHGRLDMLINNAGGQFASPAAHIRPKGWRAVIDTNLNGTFWVSQSCYRHAMGAHGGRIVSVVADMWNGFPGMAHTGAARAAVVNLTMSLAIEWAPAGVRVNAVAPGYVLSSGLANYPEPVQAVAARVMPRNPSSRLATESECSAAVTFLLTPAAAFITGTTLRVDGGASLQKEPMVPMPPHDRNPAWDGFHLAAKAPDRFK